MANIEKMTKDLEHSTLIRFKRLIAATQELEAAHNMAARATDRIAKADKAVTEAAPDLQEKFDHYARWTGRDAEELRAELVARATEALAARKAKKGADTDDDSESTPETETEAVLNDPETVAAIEEARAETSPAGEPVAAVTEDSEAVPAPITEEVQEEVKPKTVRRGGRFSKSE